MSTNIERKTSYINFYRENGFNLVPYNPGVGFLVEWKDYQHRKSTDAEIEAWKKQTESYAIVTGEVSGNLVVIDVDAEDLFEGMHLGQLAARTYTEKRGNKYHIFVRTKKPIVSDSFKIDGKEEIGIQSGGKVVFGGGMPHWKGGEQYKHVSWSPETIKTVKTDSIEALKRYWREHRGVVTKNEKGLSAPPKGLTLETPLLDVIKDCVELEEITVNGDEIKCRCPFPSHEDTHPSFGINTKKNFYNCFSCGRGGNAITFIKDFYAMSGKKAIEYLKGKGALTVAEKEDEEVFKHKCFFEEDSTLYMEVYNPEDSKYSYAYIQDGGVELIDSVGDTKPVELLVTKEGEPAKMVKMPTENVITCDLLPPPALYEKIKTHLKAYCDLPDSSLDFSVFYILFTWFHRKLNTVGYLRFIADTGKGKSRMLDAVSELCFYPLSAAGSGSFSGMMRQNESWHGTVVVDEADRSSEQVINYCLLGIEQGKYFLLSNKRDPTKQEVFNPFGPKIFSMREPFRDMALEGRCASISPDETKNDDIPILLDADYYEMTGELRDEIGRFVLEHWNEVDGGKLLSFRNLGLEPRVQQMAMPISIIAQIWPEWEQKIIDHAIGRQTELRKERAQSWAGQMFNLVLDIATGEERLLEYPTFYDGSKDIVAITPSMVAKTLKITTKTATKTLRSIGFEVETPHVRIFDGNGNSTEKKRVRCYKVPSIKKWEDLTSRYYFNGGEETQTTLAQSLNDDGIEIPEILKSQKFLEIGTLGTDGTRVYAQYEKKNNNITIDRECVTEKNKKNMGVTVSVPSVPSVPKNVCDSCGMDTETTSHKDLWLCANCLEAVLTKDKNKGIIGQFDPNICRDDKNRYAAEAGK